MTIEELLSNPELKEKFVLQKLICHFLHLSKEEFRLQISSELPDQIKNKVTSAYDDIVIQKKPLEYVIGYVEFFGNKFYVDENTLIPRPETEYMVDAVKNHCRTQNSNFRSQANNIKIKNVLIDVGTGCGVLGISILLQEPGFSHKAIFTDISTKALEVAQQNYEILIKNHDFPVEFIKSDLLDFLQTPTFNIKNSNIVLVANLPYIPEKIFEENVADNVKKREPKMAFVGGEDGLDYYRKMLDQIITIVESQKSIRSLKSNSGGLDDLMTLRPWTMFLEMMTRQIDILRAKYQDKFVFEEVKTFHFNIRIVKVTIK